jgi:ComF family protein
MSYFTAIKEALLQLAFPHNCLGCGTSVLSVEHFLCFRCLSSLPQTHFHPIVDNPVEKIFWGRVPIEAATSHYYFTKQSLLQQLMHQLKYRNNKDLGIYLGRIMGSTLASTARFAQIDALVPLPLFPEKEHQRGYNQSTMICKGIYESWEKPVLDRIVIRTHNTESQTKKKRTERWQNMENRFQLIDEAAIKGKHILLVDDIITTGATLEACAKALKIGDQTKISIATLCISAS